jgi:RND family efflux transporter MFP subunit
VIKNNIGKIIFIFIIIVLLVVISVRIVPRFFLNEEIPESDVSILVDTINPVIGDIIVTNEYIGTVEPNQQVSVYPKLAGEVLSVNYGVGDSVSAGDVLFTMDKADVEQANYAVQQQGMALSQAQIALETAEKSYQDTAALYAAGAVPLNALEQAETARTNAGLAVNRAASALAQSKSAQSRLGDAIVSAPISGEIESCNVKPYNMASPQAPAFVITNKDSMIVSFKVPRNTRDFLNLGDNIILTDSGAGYTGSITEISTAVDPSGLFTVKASVSDPAASLFSGARVKITAEAQRASNVMLLPLSVIRYEGGEPYIYAASGGLAKKVRVNTGLFDAENIEILEGAQLADKIISTWNPRLSDGAEIRTLSEEIQQNRESGEE